VASEQGDRRGEYREITLDAIPASARIRHTLFSRVLMGAIRVYQMSLSRALPPSCRFYPSCSQYTLEAIAKYGALKGAWLGIKRILRCQPFSPGGYDPVP
jgi:uncharacterized protein